MEYKIYKATNLINGICYIGSTKRSIRDRVNSHYTLARYNVSRNIKNSHFLEELLKFDKKDFKWEILEYCYNRTEAVDIENYYIEKYKNNIYNSIKACICNDGIDRNDLKNNKIYNFYNRITGGEYTGIQSDFIKLFNLSQNAVNKICNKKTKSHKGWILKENKDSKNKCKHSNKNIHLFNLDTNEEYLGLVRDFHSSKNISIIPIIYNEKCTIANWVSFKEKDNFIKGAKKWIRIDKSYKNLR